MQFTDLADELLRIITQFLPLPDIWNMRLVSFRLQQVSLPGLAPASRASVLRDTSRVELDAFVMQSRFVPPDRIADPRAKLRAAAAHVGLRHLCNVVTSVIRLNNYDDTGAVISLALGAMADVLGDRAGPFIGHVARHIENLPASFYEVLADPTEAPGRARAEMIAGVLSQCPSLTAEQLAPLVALAKRPDLVDGALLLSLLAEGPFMEPDRAWPIDVSISTLHMGCDIAIAQLTALREPEISKPFRQAFISLLFAVEAIPTGLRNQADTVALRAAVIAGFQTEMDILPPAHRRMFLEWNANDLNQARDCLLVAEHPAWDAAVGHA